MSAADELLEVVDETGTAVGLFPRSACHGNPRLAHRVAHVLVVSSDGRLLVQKRSASKDLYPGCWDTSVGGHLAPGEAAIDGARRECAEELGIEPGVLEPLSRYTMHSDCETEIVESFLLRHDGPFSPDAGEIDELRFMTDAEIDGGPTGMFTPSFLREFDEYRRYRSRHGGM